MISRPVLRWHGGKWLLAPWILAHFPPHSVYVEPFGGAASVLMRKPRSYAEVYNDLDSDLVNLFRVLRSSRAGELLEALRLTPFARDEFIAAYEHCPDEVERARRLIVRSFMGFGATGALGASTGFRAASNRSGTTPAHDWANYPSALRTMVARLQGVVIENRDALDVCRQHDSDDTLIYLDPPYLLETRSRRNPYCPKHRYRHELTSDAHTTLLSEIAALQSMVVLSGYPDPRYDNALVGWRRIERRAFADGARERVEVLWINPSAARRLSSAAPMLPLEAA